jgi:di/tricarboxylate transporter
MNQLKRGMDAPGIVFGLVLLATGAYYMLRNTFGLPLDEINWDLVWPVIVLALGGSAIFKALNQTKAA